jgi:sn-glycerol 3-phosphate transport system permease protein
MSVTDSMAVPTDDAPVLETPKRSRGGSYSAKEVGLAFVFLLPSLVVFVAFFFLPFARLLSWGTYESVRGGASYNQVGLEQYQEVLGGDEFRQGLWHSVQYVIYTVPLGLILGTVLAVAANRRLRGIKVFQAIFSSTIATSTAVASVIFLVLINPQIGVFKTDLLENSSTALFGVSLSSVWQNLGLSFVIVLAGLQAIPDDVDEAATLDGYGPVRRFFRVTLPLISPTLMFLVVVLVIFALQAFAQADILTQGGPLGSTETLVFKIFNSQQPIDQGTGAVMAIGLFAITVVVSLGQFLILDRRVHYGN